MLIKCSNRHGEKTEKKNKNAHDGIYFPFRTPET